MGFCFQGYAPNPGGIKRNNAKSFLKFTAARKATDKTRRKAPVSASKVHTAACPFFCSQYCAAAHRVLSVYRMVDVCSLPPRPCAKVSSQKSTPVSRSTYRSWGCSPSTSGMSHVVRSHLLSKSAVIHLLVGWAACMPAHTTRPSSADWITSFPTVTATRTCSSYTS